MIKTKLPAIIGFIFLLLQSTYAQKTVKTSLIKELEAADIKMFEGMTSANPEYCTIIFLMIFLL